MKNYGITSGEIDWIVLPHLHGDHFGGISVLFTETHMMTPQEQIINDNWTAYHRAADYSDLGLFFPFS
jgi:glyoxylase-like metal-dependent hydrolase (beta-lactamase superfamily II)